MKRVRFFIISIFILSVMNMQGQKIPEELETRIRYSENMKNVMYANDAENNLFFTGFFTDSVQIDDLQLYASGVMDFFIAKYNQKDELIWIKHGGGSHVDFCKFINIDQEDNIYITGLFSGRAIIEDQVMVSQGKYGYFTAKYNRDGNLLWIKTQ